jgi:Trypsin-co-occurring domain 1
MATKLLKLSTQEGDILIAAPVPDSMVQATGLLEDSIEALSKSLDEVLRVLVGVSRSFENVFKDVTAETADLELGLQFTAKGSVYVVEATGQASLKIKLSFRHTPKP